MKCVSFHLQSVKICPDQRYKKNMPVPRLNGDEGQFIIDIKTREFVEN